MTMLSKTKLVFLDVETTGLSPAMGDHVVELGIIVCQTSHLINPGRQIPGTAQHVHGISDQDVSGCPPFAEIAEEIKSTLVDSWIVGHNVRFDIGFIAMELEQAGCTETPLGCLDTCQLASALWDFPNYKLETVVNALDMPSTDPASVASDSCHNSLESVVCSQTRSKTNGGTTETSRT